MNDFSIAFFQPEDAPDISNIYREIYGDAFPMKYVYDPEEIVRRYDGLNHLAAIARDANGQLAGVCSLFRSSPNPCLYEMGQLMVSKPYRKHGLAHELLRILIEEHPDRVPLKAIFGEALCNHTISQHTLENLNFIPTGLELEWLPAMNFDKGGQLDVNISLLLEFLILHDNPHVLYPHPDYTGFVQDCCRRLGTERTLRTGAAPKTDTTEAQTMMIREASVATLAASRMGTNWPKELDRFEARTDGCGLHVQINIGDPAAPWATDVLREKGYFFGGYLPLWFETDGILFQKLPNPPDFSVPIYDSDNGRTVADAVQKDWERMNHA